MNTENLGYLQKQLLNLGFGEQMNEALEKQIKAKTPEFTLAATNEYSKQSVDYTLHFKMGDQNEMYFFNKYDASLREKDMQQTFYINKGSGITAKEAYNLMDGRAVHKELENKDGENTKPGLRLIRTTKPRTAITSSIHFPRAGITSPSAPLTKWILLVSAKKAPATS
ncbi:hypothetical protein [Mucilaginibacter auburnensis]|uniref:hypothetical protein n=1 Tax=Mucilaginibacter auburnensis TaxID=1457233 RepID=UPI000C23EDBA|nr:hypothetical protein [Mucilaginibacter auburnensis]